MNILITSSGRQSFLIKSFKKSLKQRGKIYTCDINKNSLSFNYSDGSFIAPKYEDKHFINFLIKKCAKYKIRLLITLSVEELLILEKNRHHFNKINCFLVGGEIESILNTYDKYKMFKMCKSQGIPTIETQLTNNVDKVSKKSIIKSRFGKGSRGIFIIEKHVKLKRSIRNSNFIIQEFISGQEYGIDIINNFNGEFVSMNVREKQAMANGETVKAKTLDSEEWIHIGKKIGAHLKHHGIIDIDAILSNEKLYIIDINHRFGGGYIFNHEAGCNVPKAYLEWLNNNNNNNSLLNYINNIQSQKLDNGSLKRISNA